MLAFDLDGVFVPDVAYETISPEDKALVRKYSIPLFIPECDYVIITGRNIEHKELTQAWVDEHFKQNPPKKLYHDNDHWSNGGSYKAQVLNELKNSVNIYIESDIEIVELIGPKVIQTVYHFSDILMNALPISKFLNSIGGIDD